MGNSSKGLEWGLGLGSLVGAPIGWAIGSEKEAEKSRIKALKERMRQEEDVSRENSIHNMEKINNTLASQAAISAARGGGMAGPVSSNMISMADINSFAADENVNKMNEVFQKEAIESQIAATAKTSLAKEISTGVSGAVDIGEIALGAIVPGAQGAAVSGVSGLAKMGTSASQSNAGTYLDNHLPDVEI